MASNRFSARDIPGRIVAAICLAVLGASPVLAQTESAVVENKWQFSGALYLWSVDMGGTTKKGSDVEVEFDDLVDNVELGFMGVLEARKNRWLLFTDVMYFDLSADSSTNLSIRLARFSYL